MTELEFKTAIGTKNGFGAAIATPDGKAIVEKVVAELFPHIKKERAKDGYFGRKLNRHTKRIDRP